MGKYKKLIAKNDKVEMIHVSLERGESGDELAEEWAAKEKFPWPTILPSEVQKSGFRKFKTTGFVPEYALIDKDGKQVANGQEAVFKAIEELASEET